MRKRTHTQQRKRTLKRCFRLTKAYHREFKKTLLFLNDDIELVEKTAPHPKTCPMGTETWPYTCITMSIGLVWGVPFLY